MDPINVGRISTERSAVVAWYLAHGESLTTSQIIDLTGLTRDGALKMMRRISRVLPLYQNDVGQWEVCDLQDLSL